MLCLKELIHILHQTQLGRCDQRKEKPLCVESTHTITIKKNRLSMTICFPECCICSAIMDMLSQRVYDTRHIWHHVQHLSKASNCEKLEVCK